MKNSLDIFVVLLDQLRLYSTPFEPFLEIFQLSLILTICELIYLTSEFEFVAVSFFIFIIIIY